MTLLRRTTNLALVFVLFMSAISFAAPQSVAAAIATPPIPLPRNCDAVTPIGGNTPACCIFGYVYYENSPVDGAAVHIDSASGAIDLTTYLRGAHSAPYYQADLSSAPLAVSPGDVITITVSYSYMLSIRTWIVQGGGQHVDMGLIAGYRAQQPVNTSGGPNRPLAQPGLAAPVAVAQPNSANAPVNTTTTSSTGNVSIPLSDTRSPQRASLNASPLEFSDNFESYALGANPSDVYSYQPLGDWTSYSPLTFPDSYQVGQIGANKVLQFTHASPNAHMDAGAKIYKRQFSRLSKAGVSFYRTNPSMGWNHLVFEYQDDQHYYIIKYAYDNTLYIGYSQGGVAGSVALWGDADIMSLNNRIEVVRDGNQLIASVTRLDTLASKSITVTAPL